jgi:hypothetical protein
VVLPGADWQVSSCLHRMSWLLHAHAVETKLRQLADACKYNFDPNQPRVPAGNSDGGQWTDAGGGRGGATRVGGGAGTSESRIRLAQNDSPGTLTDIPEEEPGSARLRNSIIKQVAIHVARLALEDALGGSGGADTEYAGNRVLGPRLCALHYLVCRRAEESGGIAGCGVDAIEGI